MDPNRLFSEEDIQMVKQALISIGSAPVTLAPFSHQTQNRPLRARLPAPAPGGPLLVHTFQFGCSGGGGGAARGGAGAVAVAVYHPVRNRSHVNTWCGCRSSQRLDAVPVGVGKEPVVPGASPAAWRYPNVLVPNHGWHRWPLAAWQNRARSFSLLPRQAVPERPAGAARRPLCPKELPSDLGSGGTSCFTSRNPSPAFSPSPSRVTSSCNVPADRMPQPGNPGLFLRKEEGPGLPEPLTDVCGKGLPHLPNRQLPFSFSRARDGRNRP
ncbi:uncharacterized protein LOC113601150 [Acinonyx jubatus]|uniref:Uncharacterized protein LOC113601150 n=1 Tax=Acinonyx jubatus TaxID=32536 RepID=A0ABM3NC55_ACIJB|nr:uncharacterized protein LOC113601150 [Acinonyx jubatus]